jgi:hypothetical protein
MHGLSARAEIRGKRATKNIRKLVFPEVLFDLLVCTNRILCAFSEVFFSLLASIYLGHAQRAGPHKKRL